MNNMRDQLSYHERFTDEEFDAQYNLRAGRPDYELTVIPDWQSRSASCRAELSPQLDIHYGQSDRQRLDFFHCQNADAPTLIYFHGGYWQRGDKSIYSFLAQPFVSAGINVAVVGYELCPNVSITQISQQAREALAYLYLHAADLSIDNARFTVMGHSAGGHITQMLMATDWPSINSDLPKDLIKSAIPVSPLSYLEPVRRTTALNTNLQMDEEEAHKQSPMTLHPPVTNAPQLVVVGGAETSEFHRQSNMYVEAYNNSQRSVTSYVVPDVDHFDELNVLADTSSEFFNLCLVFINR